jgi:outer membrane protein assembly factor BamB
MKIQVYTRREFLKAAGLGVAAVVVSGCSLDAVTKTTGGAQALPCKFSGPIKGRVLVDSKPRAGIAVSDGFDIVFTDAKGRFKLPNEKSNAPFVFVIQPNDVAKNSTTFYRMPFQLEGGQKRIDFALSHAAANQSLTHSRFILITDIHTSDAARGEKQEQATEEVFKLVPPADFIIADGDLVERGSDVDEFSNYMASVQISPIPYFNAIGNHDVDKTPDTVNNYRWYIGPDYYAFDDGGVHFVILNSITPSDRQSSWFAKDLAMLGKNKPVVVFQHYPPTSDELRKLDKLNVHSIFTGHWHSEKVVKSKKTVSVTTPSFDMGGIDFSPAGFKVVDIAAEGMMRTQYRPIGVSKWAKIVWPTGVVCNPDKSRQEIIANVYDSSIDAKKINFKLHQKGQLKVSGKLKQQSPLNWTASLPDSIETGKGEIEIEVEGQPDWKAKSSFNIPDCAVPAIKTNGDWPMFMGNPAHTGTSNANLSLPLALVWSTYTGGDIDLSSPILAVGKLFVAVKARRSDAFMGVLAIEPATGKILWQFATEQSINHSPAHEAGVVCIVEVGGRVYGIDAQSGKELWRHDLGDNIGRWIYGAPAADEGKFYVGSVNRFARIDARTGKVDWEKWLANTEPAEKAGYPNDWISAPVSPAISGRYLAMGGFWTGKDNLFVVDKTIGRTIWSHPADRGMHSSPTIAGDKILFLGKTSLLHCCNLADGKLIWKKQIGEGSTGWIGTGWSATTPAVKGDIVIAGSGDGVMMALKLSDGSEIWSHRSGEGIFKISPYRTDNVSVLSSPTIAGDKVFFASGDGKLYCVDFATGKELWSFDFGVPVLSTPLTSGNGIFVAAYDGRIYAFSGGQNKEKTAFLTGRGKNENCNWQRPCRFYLQRGHQAVFDERRPYGQRLRNIFG